jgi:hypothetical protein
MVHGAVVTGVVAGAWKLALCFKAGFAAKAVATSACACKATTAAAAGACAGTSGGGAVAGAAATTAAGGAAYAAGGIAFTCVAAAGPFLVKEGISLIAKSYNDGDRDSRDRLVIQHLEDLARCGAAHPFTEQNEDLSGGPLMRSTKLRELILEVLAEIWAGHDFKDDLLERVKTTLLKSYESRPDDMVRIRDGAQHQLVGSLDTRGDIMLAHKPAE